MVECKNCKFYIKTSSNEKFFYCNWLKTHMSDQVNGCMAGVSKNITMGDKFRSLDDTGIANLCCSFGVCPEFGDLSCIEDCFQCWLNFLKKPYKD